MSPEDLALAIEAAVQDTYDDYAVWVNTGSLLSWACDFADSALARRLEKVLSEATGRELHLQPWRRQPSAPTSTTTPQGGLPL